MGFELIRFEGSVDDELICAICDGVLENPIQIITCEHVFCAVCLENWFQKGNRTCPLDRDTVNHDDVKTPRIVTNLLAKLTIRCDFAASGCQTMVKLENLSHHCGQCDYNPDKKIRCAKGCGLTLLRVDLPNHNCMEELHNLVRGQTEQINNQQKQINELKVEIEKLIQTQVTIGNENVQIKEMIKNMDVKLYAEHKQTKIIKKGIERCADVWKRLEEYDRVYSDENNTQKSTNPKVLIDDKQVSVRYNDRRVRVDPSQKISDVKLYLKSNLGVNSGKLKLFHEHKELEDHHTLAHYGLLNVENPELIVAVCDEIQILVKIRVMNTTENIKHPWTTNILPQTIALTVDKSQTIAQVKEEVKLISNIKSEKVLLTFGSQSLEDHCQLLQYGIGNGDTINYYASHL